MVLTRILLLLTETSKKHGLGNEYDVNLNYNYTEDVTFGVSLGWFVPGNVFTDANTDTASQAIADVASEVLTLGKVRQLFQNPRSILNGGFFITSLELSYRLSRILEKFFILLFSFVFSLL